MQLTSKTETTHTLTLTQTEAEYLRFVCALIGGDKGAPPREFFEELRDALNKAGVSRPVLKIDEDFPAGILFR